MKAKADGIITNEDGSKALVEHKMMNPNKRHPNEYRLVTDGNKFYRLHPKFFIPEGVFEVFHYEGQKVYNSKGKLMSKFQALQRIQPRINLSKVTIAVRQALGIRS